ncbi:MAG: xylulokinase, partial [Bdellovibrionales bacterium]|nr:xylulokinase [Bdellovibrionales bacterium]
MKQPPSPQKSSNGTLVLGLDIGTSGTKALLIDDTGKVVGGQTVPHPISNPHPLWSEQNPRDWWSSAVEAIRITVAGKGVRERIKGVGLAGQMHGLVCLDAGHHVLRPALLWNDQRTQAQCDWLHEHIGTDKLAAITGNRALTGFTAPKLLWVRAHEPEVFGKIAHILLPKDYVRFRLSGTLATDLADASGTLLLDVKHRHWSEELLEAAEIPLQWLPSLHEGTDI